MSENHVPNHPRGAVMIFQDTDGQIYVCEADYPRVNIDWRAELTSSAFQQVGQFVRDRHWRTKQYYSIEAEDSRITVYASYEDFIRNYRPAGFVRETEGQETLALSEQRDP